MNNRKFKGELLKQKRMELGLSQLELTNEVNSKNNKNVVDATTISRWEINPNAVPRNNKLVKVASVLGCQAEDFFEADNSINFKMISLNVNNFCGLKSWKENEKELMNMTEEYFPVIETYLKNFLNVNKHGVIILQEVPKIKCEDFLKTFEKYSVIKPVYLSDAKICTLAVVNYNSGWKKIEKDKSVFANDFNYSNRIVEITNEKINVIGVHMNEDVSLWTRLIEHLSKSTIVIGDFNAHYNNHRKSNFRYMLEKIKQGGYRDLVDNDVVTFYPAMTTVDHVFCSEELNDKEIKCEVIPKNYSDHAVICVDVYIQTMRTNQ